jgi:hypothetical protein
VFLVSPLLNVIKLHVRVKSVDLLSKAPDTGYAQPKTLVVLCHGNGTENTQDRQAYRHDHGSLGEAFVNNKSLRSHANYDNEVAQSRSLFFRLPSLPPLSVDLAQKNLRDVLRF